MSKHTPGPWQVAENYDSRTGPHVYIEREYDGDGVTNLAGIYTVAEVADQAFLPEGTQVANARLIAKAPELLELAQFVRDACVRLNNARAVDAGNGSMLTEELDDMGNQASALLAKIDRDA